MVCCVELLINSIRSSLSVTARDKEFSPSLSLSPPPSLSLSGEVHLSPSLSLSPPPCLSLSGEVHC